MEWIKNLKIGDRFITGEYPEIMIHKILRFTNTLIITTITNCLERKNEYRFKKSNGKEIGGDLWHTEYMKEITDSVRIELLRQRVNYLLKTTSLLKLNAGQLEKIKDAILER